MDKESIVKTLATALDGFGKADITVRFETETQIIITIVSDFFKNIETLERVEVVLSAVQSKTEIDFKKFSITIFPVTEMEECEFQKNRVAHNFLTD